MGGIEANAANSAAHKHCAICSTVQEIKKSQDVIKGGEAGSEGDDDDADDNEDKVDVVVVGGGEEEEEREEGVVRGVKVVNEEDKFD